MKYKILTAVLLGLFASFTFNGSVFAIDCGEGCSLELNAELLAAGISDTNKALEMTKGELNKPEDQRDGKPIVKLLEDSILSMKRIVHNAWDARLQSPKGKMRIASHRLKKGKYEEAKTLLEQAIVKLNNVDRGD